MTDPDAQTQAVRRIPAHPGWVVDLPYPQDGSPRALLAVIEWEYDPEENSTKALCLGPLGLEESVELHEIEITNSRSNPRIRFAPDVLNQGGE